ncbi:DMT family transporter [Litorivicinus sp.]|nr:DMT family transporter [Litorivicinus sp.]MDC1239592.1 DMT family transporter [Litorivicinus sp.]
MAIADWLRILLLSVLWGGSFFFVEIMLEALPPLTAVYSRLLVGLAGLIALLAILGYQFDSLITQWRAFAFIGLVNTALPFTLITFGQTEITGALASIINAATPIMTALIAHWLTRDERLSLNKIIGIGLGFLGVLVLFGPAVLGVDASFFGMFAGLSATVCYAFGSVFSKRLKRNPPMINAVGQVFYAVIWMTPLVALVDSPWNLEVPGLSVVTAIFGIGLLSTSFAFYLYFRVLETAGASNVTLVTFLIPVSASALGILFLKETLGLQDILAYCLIATGLAAIDGRIFRMLGIKIDKLHTQNDEPLKEC